jgi:hypothetical protein
MWGEEGVPVVASQPYRELTDEDRALGIQGPFTRSWPTYTGFHALGGDGAGGAIVFWHEEDYPERRHRAFAQRVGSAGETAWPEPVLLKSGGDVPRIEPIASATDEAPGVATVAIRAAFAIADPRPGTTLMWLDMNGKVLSQKMLGNLQDIEGDGSGGVIIDRFEETPGFGPPWERSVQVSFQRHDREGNALWEEKPIIATAKGWSVGTVTTAVDSNGEAFAAWRTGQSQQRAYGRVGAQRLDAAGNIRRVVGGTVFDRSLRYHGNPVAIGSDSGVIVVAPVGKSGLFGNMVYAQKLDVNDHSLWGGGIRVDR